MAPISGSPQPIAELGGRETVVLTVVPGIDADDPIQLDELSSELHDAMQRGGLSRFSLMLRDQLLDILLQSLSMVKQVCDSTAGKRILVIDDDASIAGLVAEAIAGGGLPRCLGIRRDSGPSFCSDPGS